MLVIQGVPDLLQKVGETNIAVVNDLRFSGFAVAR